MRKEGSGRRPLMATSDSLPKMTPPRVSHRPLHNSSASVLIPRLSAEREILAFPTNDPLLRHSPLLLTPAFPCTPGAVFCALLCRYWSGWRVGEPNTHACYLCYSYISLLTHYPLGYIITQVSQGSVLHSSHALMFLLHPYLYIQIWDGSVISLRALISHSFVKRSNQIVCDRC